MCFSTENNSFERLNWLGLGGAQPKVLTDGVDMNEWLHPGEVTLAYTSFRSSILSSVRQARASGLPLTLHRLHG